MTDCIFCKIIKKEIPTNIISETADSMAFLDAFPLAKGHTLVIPKKHHSKIQEMTDAENTDLFNLVHKTIAKVDSITGATLVAIHNGKEAGQEIPHVHVHLVPRSKDDSAGAIHSMFGSTIKLSDEETNQLLSKLKD